MNSHMLYVYLLFIKKYILYLGYLIFYKNYIKLDLFWKDLYTNLMKIK